MKKNLFVILLGISLLSCSIFSPATAPTQSVDVVFRSPRDMNLQPRDVPDLEEVPVEEPSDVALLPEAIDQDQRAYISVEQNIYIESSVIMVPERTTRQPREVANEIVKYRNPKMKISGSERSVSVGEKAIIIGITGYCSSKHSDGFILVFFRNNIIVVIVACGNVNEEYVRFIGAKVENNVKAPPAPEEIAGTGTREAALNLTSVPVPPTRLVLTPTALSECDQLKLTIEECANLGLHTYSRSSTLLYRTHDWIGCGGVSDTLELNIEFPSPGSLFIRGYYAQNNWLKTGDNSYKSVNNPNEGTLTFYSTGFTITIRAYVCGDNSCYCDEETVFTLLK